VLPGRKIVGGPKGNAPLARLQRWNKAPVDLATVSHILPCTQPKGPITGRMANIEMVAIQL